jgi:hypothetical protein
MLQSANFDTEPQLQLITHNIVSLLEASVADSQATGHQWPISFQARASDSPSCGQSSPRTEAPCLPVTIPMGAQFLISLPLCTKRSAENVMP